VNVPACTSGVPAGSSGWATPSCGCALAFASVRLLLRAGHALRQAGIDVLVVPRRVDGCGVLLLVGQDSVTVALSLLSIHAIVPAEVLPYDDVQGS
jgi:hypothetical protein